MLIALVDPPHLSRSGDWWYRSGSPAGALAERPDTYVVNVDSGHRACAVVLHTADVVVLHNVCDADLLPVIDDRRRRGLTTVFEINDDVSAVQPWNAAYAFYRQRENFTLLLQLARAADGLVLSSAELERLYGYLHPRRRVLRNQLARLLPLAPLLPRAKSEPLTIGWGGSHGHLQDVARVAPALSRFAETHDVRLHIMGAESIWQLFDALPADKKRYTPPGTIDEYEAFLRTCDIGLAPLDDTAFNRCRSDVKFLEYAAQGTVALLERSVAYRQVPDDAALFFASDTELTAQLDQLVSDGALRERLRQAAHGHVAAHRRESAHSDERATFYQQLADGRSVAAVADVAARFARLTSAPGARVEGRLLLFEPTAYEQLLHAGMAEKANAPAAERLFDEASRLAPSSYLPHLYAGMVTRRATRFDAALQKNPRSVRARMGLASALAKAGDLRAALGQLFAVGEAVPGYAAPFALAAQLFAGTADAALFGSHAEALTAPLWPSWLPAFAADHFGTFVREATTSAATAL